MHVSNRPWATRHEITMTSVQWEKKKKMADALFVSSKFTKFTNNIVNWEILKAPSYFKAHFLKYKLPR